MPCRMKLRTREKQAKDMVSLINDLVDIYQATLPKQPAKLKPFETHLIPDTTLSKHKTEDRKDILSNKSLSW